MSGQATGEEGVKSSAEKGPPVLQSRSQLQGWLSTYDCAASHSWGDT